LVESPGSHGFYFRSGSTDCVCSGNSASNVPKTASIYGFWINDLRVNVSGCKVSGGDRGFWVDTDNANLDGCFSYDPLTAGFETQGADQFNVFTGCVCDGSDGDGFRIGGQHNTLTGCFAYNPTNEGFQVNEKWGNYTGCRSYNAGGQGFDMGTNGNTCSFTGCLATGGGGNGYNGFNADCLLSGCRSRGNTGDGFNFDGTNIKLEGCYSEDDARGFVMSGADASLSGCYALNSTDHGFHMTGAQPQLDGCYANSCGSAAGDYGFNVENTAANPQFVGCYALDNFDHGFWVNGTESVLNGCVSKGNGGNGFNLPSSADHSLMTGCLADANTSTAFNLGGSTAGVQVVGCRARSTPAGVTSFLVQSNFVNMSGCLAEGGSVGFDIQSIEGSVSNCLARDTGSASGHYGFRVAQRNVNLTGCYTNGSYDHGIYVNAAGCTVTGCYSHNSGRGGTLATASGIYLDAGADSGKITDNYLEGNSNYGVEEVAGCDGNHFADNFYFDNFTSAALWAATTAYSLNDTVRATATAQPHLYFEATTAGTSGGTEPTWNLNVGGTTTDGTVVWTTRSTVSLGGSNRTRLDREGTLIKQEGLTEVISVYDAVGGQTLNATPITVNLDTTKVNTRSALYSLATDVITIAQDGVYLFNFHMTGINGANQASSIRCYLERDSGGGFALETGTQVYAGDIGNTEEDTAGGCIALTVAAGDQFRLRGDRSAGNSNSLTTLQNASVLTITRLA
jgi:hypothetical protein